MEETFIGGVGWEEGLAAGGSSRAGAAWEKAPLGRRQGPGQRDRGSLIVSVTSYMPRGCELDV